MYDYFTRKAKQFYPLNSRINLFKQAQSIFVKKNGCFYLLLQQCKRFAIEINVIFLHTRYICFQEVLLKKGFKEWRVKNELLTV